jgi:aerobic C4-dicarboxylate transport protein
MTAPRLLRSLYFQVLVAITIGILLGRFAPQTGAAMKPLGDGFIKLIKMIISPIIFTTVVLGIANTEELKKVGRTGGLALLYFEVVSTISLLLGVLIVNLLRPGAGMDADLRTLDTSAVAAYTGPGKMTTAKDFILNIIPSTFFDAFAKGEILQVLFLAILFGIALQQLGTRGKLMIDIVEKLSQVLFGIVGIIMRVAPIGAFGAMAFTVGTYGLGSLLSLSRLMAAFYLTCLIFIFVVLGAIARIHGFSIFRYVYYIRDEIMIVLGTSSSEAALPRMMAKIESLGAGRSTVGLVIPTGYSFNLDGTSIYLSMAAIFIAQATNTPLTIWQQLTLLIVLMLTSKGAAAVTGSGFVVLAATLSATGTLPVGGLALILGIDRFMSEARAITNVIGNGVAALVVAKWTNDLDMVVLNRQLQSNTTPSEVTQEIA